MELRQLRHFVAVVECGNLSQAARKVHISQPALTRSIKALEDLLRARLLDRKPRGVVPTATGEVFYQHAKLILNECRRAKEDVSGVEAGAVGQVNIGIAAMFAAFIIDEAVANVTEHFPKLHVSVTEGFYEDLIAQLRDGHLDAIFTNFPVASVESDLALEPLWTVTAVTLVAARHPLARKRKIAAADVADAKWVVVNQPHVAETFDHLFAENRLAMPASTVRTNSLDLIKALVLRRGFVSFLPEHLVSEELKRGELAVLKLPQGRIERRAGLIMRSGAQPRPALTHVLKEIRRACAAARP
jgi:DNA-binding transcriptional LysR family regulator